jgi:hypothetical protein
MVRIGAVSECLRYCTRKHKREKRQVVLLDGTIIREWGPK